MKILHVIVTAVVVGVSLFDSTPVMANKRVAEHLNAADQLFNAGMDGCSSATIAIVAFNSPEIFGANTVSRNEISRYANRCNLRF